MATRALAPARLLFGGPSFDLSSIKQAFSATWLFIVHALDATRLKMAVLHALGSAPLLQTEETRGILCASPPFFLLSLRPAKVEVRTLFMSTALLALPILQLVCSSVGLKLCMETTPCLSNSVV
jgi:hypothetical protein